MWRTTKTITVIKDINITAEQEIANIGNGKNIILDLNGHKVLSYKREIIFVIMELLLLQIQMMSPLVL